MAGAYFRINPMLAGKFTFTLHQADGQVLLTSQSFSTRADTLKGIEAARASATLDASYHRKELSSARRYFMLKTAQGLTIGSSELYASKAALEDAIRVVVAGAGFAPTRDDRSDVAPRRGSTPFATAESAWANTEWCETSFDPRAG